MGNTWNVKKKKSDPSPGQYSDPPALVLASLADGRKHGYAIFGDICQMCGTRLGPGPLYGAITRRREGLIEPLESRAPPTPSFNVRRPTSAASKACNPACTSLSPD